MLGGRLPRATRPKQPKDLPTPDRKADPRQCLALPVWIAKLKTINNYRWFCLPHVLDLMTKNKI
jgi:hypothetical protein